MNIQIKILFSNEKYTNKLYLPNFFVDEKIKNFIQIIKAEL